MKLCPEGLNLPREPPGQPRREVEIAEDNDLRRATCRIEETTQNGEF